MVLSSAWVKLLLAVSALSSSAVAAPQVITDADATAFEATAFTSGFTQADINSGKALDELNKRAAAAVKARLSTQKGGACTWQNVKIRQEWRTLPVATRQSFINAVKCVRSKPSLYTGANAIPGSKSLYDDFIAVHLNQTLTIHLTATFLTWHRWYIQEYEHKLQQCGYTGVLPYWNWGLDVSDVTKSPVFDGSPLSLGGNGKFIPHEGLQMPQPIPPTIISIPPGTGSGCVTTGPFGALTMRLGPVAMPNYGNTNSTAAADPLADNLRCLKRDLNTAVLAKYSSFKNVTDLILNSPGVGTFQAIMQGDPRVVTGELGVHGGGHFTIGGDPGSDPFISPGDPAFWLHHGQVDRLYWIWQNLDWKNRQNVVGGFSFLDFFPGPNVTLDTLIDIAPLSQPISIRKLMSTVGEGGPLCYIYQ